MNPQTTKACLKNLVEQCNRFKKEPQQNTETETTRPIRPKTHIADLLAGKQQNDQQDQVAELLKTSESHGRTAEPVTRANFMCLFLRQSKDGVCEII